MIVWINPNNSKHTSAYTKIDRQSIGWLYSPKETKLKESKRLRLNALGHPNKDIRFGIAEKEHCELIGWVHFYKDEIKRVKKLKKTLKISKNLLILEVSYAKLHKRNKEYKGVAVNGLKQSLEILCQMEKKISKILHKKPRTIYITAYTDPKNIASEVVLKRNEFTVLPQSVNYKHHRDHAWVKILPTFLYNTSSAKI